MSLGLKQTNTDMVNVRGIVVKLKPSQSPSDYLAYF